MDITFSEKKRIAQIEMYKFLTTIILTVLRPYAFKWQYWNYAGGNKVNVPKDNFSPAAH